MATSGPSIDQIKASMRSAWMAGDFGQVAKTISRGAETFVQRLSLPPESRVLDVACGTGNLAIPLARSGHHVTGVDIASNLVAQARDRAAAEQLRVRFDEGDAEQLPYPDSSFDAVVTMFGAMFAPRPEMVVQEFARVLRPGGHLAMANWNPESFSGAMFRVSAQHAPGAPGIPPPVLWGDEQVVRQRLTPFFHEIHTRIVPVDFDLPTNAAGAVAFFRQYFGPTQVAFNKLDDAGKAVFAADLEALWAGANASPDPDQHTLVHNQYLEVRATRV